jgi:hypothetical protein
VPGTTTYTRSSPTSWLLLLVRLNPSSALVSWQVWVVPLVVMLLLMGLGVLGVVLAANAAADGHRVRWAPGLCTHL